MFRIGDVEVIRVEEFHGPAILPSELLPNWSQEALTKHKSWLAPAHLDPSEGRLILSTHSWVLRTKHHTIVIDTCIGNGKERPYSGPLFHKASFPYLANLAAAGIRPDDVDCVVCTHLHADHVGWNTRLEDERWVPTFPSAKYFLPETDRDVFDPIRSATGAIGDNAQVFADSISPVLEGRQTVLVKGGESLDEAVTLEPSPGHTPGHISVRLSSRGRQALFSGDVIHHPVQIYNPDWSTAFCADPDRARSTRKVVLEQASDADVLVCPAHFGPCTIQRRGSGFRYVPSAETS